MKYRAAVCEALAVHVSIAAQRNDAVTLQYLLDESLRRDPEVRSLAIRRANGSLLAQAGNHTVIWKPMADARSTPEQVHVPIVREEQPFGDLEIAFTSPAANLLSFLKIAGLSLLLFVVAGCFLVHRFYLRKVLQHLDPSAVIPEHVQAMLDNLTEGILVMDARLRIVLANDAFANAIGAQPEALMGRQVDRIPFELLPVSNGATAPAAPWVRSLKDGQIVRRMRLGLTLGQEIHTFMVSSAPILAPNGFRRGVLASFDDVTWLEDKNAELQKTVSMLNEAQDTLSRQNEKLHKFATRDPLTDCLNRRAFFEILESAFETAKRYGEPLACIMVDIDHFKAVNDRYGHAVGDQVLQHVAATLQSAIRTSDCVCRLGGEEFCILLQRGDAAVATGVGEKLRLAIAGSPCGDVFVTASLGVSGLDFYPKSPAEMIDQADQALYSAKSQGRNRVLVYGQLASDAAKLTLRRSAVLDKLAGAKS
jgi:diguanylate cyclase (GGDEF)-like protein